MYLDPQTRLVYPDPTYVCIHRHTYKYIHILTYTDPYRQFI